MDIIKRLQTAILTATKGNYILNIFCFDQVFFFTDFFTGSQEEVDADMWYPREPNGRNTQLCVPFYRWHTLLSDSGCVGRKNYICEIQKANGEN